MAASPPAGLLRLLLRPRGALLCLRRGLSSSESSESSLLRFSASFPASLRSSFSSSLLLRESFVSESEEASLIKEVEPHLSRLVYEKDHWDDAIANFRETERKNWNRSNAPVLDRLRAEAFETDRHHLLPYVHVLDLNEKGHIKPHVDSSRFCGDVVAVLSLLSPAVAKFVHTEEKDHYVHCLIPRRSLYIMKDTARYDFTHEILPGEGEGSEDPQASEDVLRWARDHPRTRRVSVVCRCRPQDEVDAMDKR